MPAHKQRKPIEVLEASKETADSCEAEFSDRPDGRWRNVVRLRGLPYAAVPQDVSDFVGHGATDIVLEKTRDGRSSRAARYPNVELQFHDARRGADVLLII